MDPIWQVEKHEMIGKNKNFVLLQILRSNTIKNSSYPIISHRMSVDPIHYAWFLDFSDESSKENIFFTSNDCTLCFNFLIFFPHFLNKIQGANIALRT